MRKFLSAVGTALLLASLAGCIGPGVVKTPVPTPSATPVFASDEEALAAAEAAYAAYLKELDLSLATYETSNLEAVADASALSEALESVDGFRSDKRKLTGKSSIDTVNLIQAQQDGHVDFYVCLDISATDVVDDSGKSVVVASRPTRLPMQVATTWVADRSQLVISGADLWDGGNFCE